jgi:hypothetical protein
MMYSNDIDIPMRIFFQMSGKLDVSTWFGEKGKKENTQVCRFGVIGLPNAGKSTLTNWLAGGTISAVSVRPETTRKPVLGAFTDGQKQAWTHPLSAVAFWYLTAARSFEFFRVWKRLNIFLLFWVQKGGLPVLLLVQFFLCALDLHALCNV